MIIPIIVGPTGIGKTNLSILLAKRLNGEIISADSMQVYKQMDIGTAKATKEEMQGIKHYLIDILNPNERFTVVEFKKESLNIINKIKKSNKYPIIAGGTGLYVNSLVYNYNFEKDLEYTKTSEEEYNKNIVQFRKEIIEKLDKNEITLNQLYKKALDIDYDSAIKISETDRKRIVKILEIYYTTKQTKTFIDKIRKEEQEILKKEYEKENNVVESQGNQYMIFELTMDRKKLYDRINKRIDLMIEQGLVEEVKKIVEYIEKEEGKTITQIQNNALITSLQAIGYKEVIEYLQGNISYEEMVYLLKRDSRRYAKRQMTWFRKSNCIKLDRNKTDEELLNEILVNLKINK